MLKRLRNLLLGTTFAFLLAAPVATVVVPTTAYAAGPVCETRFLLGVPAWYRGLVKDDCSIKSPSDVGGLASFIWRIALNLIEAGLVLAGYIAIFFILYGGAQFIAGGGNSSQIEKARKTILNAVIGLAISIASIAIINLVFSITG